MGKSRTYALVLAAGAGTRFGGPKVRARGADGTPWLHLVVRALREGGCDGVIVTVPPGVDATDVLPSDVDSLVVADAAEGIAASVRAGLLAAAGVGADAVLVSPIDVPGLPAAAVARVLAAGRQGHVALVDALVQARYEGVPGHPVLIGAAHWHALREQLRGDVGAGPYLRTHAARVVECGDLWSGADIDARPTGTASAG